MKTQFSRSVAWTMLALTCASSALALVSQEPLLSKTVNVKPNIALVLDTSGSMEWECVYAKQVTDAFVKEKLSMYGLDTNCLADTDDRRHASPVNNLLFYNPKTTYLRSYDNTGVLNPTAPVTNGSIVTLYLPKPGQDPTTYTTTTELTKASNYDSYQVTATRFKFNGDNTLGNSNPFGAHGGTRTDCAGAICTFGEERKNIANWHAYNFNRIKAARTGLGAAFSSQADNFRLAYGTIYGSPNTMKDFGAAKTSFYKWLDARVSGEGNGTPLRAALNRAGNYYSQTVNDGPWGSNPSAPPQGEIASNHLSCRRSYTLMITDGFYNDSYSNVEVAPTVKDVDGTNGTQFIHDLDASKTFKYIPGDKSDPRSIGKSDKTTGSSGYSNTLSDVALKYWGTDLRTDLPNSYGAGGPNDPPFWQNMTSYMVSFGAPGSMSETDVTNATKGLLDWVQPSPNKLTTIDDMRHAAHNGGGQYLKVNDAQQFATDLGNLIGSIAGQQFSQSGVAASAVTLTNGTMKFVPEYTSGTWWGNVRMEEIATNTKKWQVIELDTNGAPTGKTTIPSPASRNIVVWVNAATQGVDFNFTNITAGVNALKGTNANMQMSNAVTSDVVDFLKGNRNKEGTTFRTRQAILGDIVNSTPAFIKNNTNPQYEKLPANTAGKGDYAAYMKDKADRTEGVLFVGANDGMLHAFAEGYSTKVGGREVFAYIPRSVLGKLEGLADSGYTFAHKYTVDGPMTETDAYVTTPNSSSGGSSTGWRNLLVGTTGSGAKSVFALNVTNPLGMNGKTILWEINPDPAFPVMPGNSTTSFAELGHVLSPIQSGITVSGDWVSIFGNGYDSKSGKASLYIVESGSGKLIRHITTDSVASNGLGGVHLVRNNEQQIIGAYAGDLQGRVWKFDLSGSTPATWGLGNGGVALFTATNGAVTLPITAMPTVTLRTDQPNYSPSYLVTIGTGKLTEIADKTNISPNQMVYGLWDRQPFGSTTVDTILDASLEATKHTEIAASNNAGAVTAHVKMSYLDPNVTSIDWTTRRGWKLALDVHPGERVIDPVVSELQIVKIDTVSPDTSASDCKASNSNGLNIVVDPLTGICRVGGTLDTNNDGNIDGNDAGDVCGYSTIADGRDVILIMLDSQNEDTGLRNAQNSNGGIPFRAGNPPQPKDCTNPLWAAAHPEVCVPNCSDPVYAAANPAKCTADCSTPGYSAAHPGDCPGGTLNRSWRQIFPRAN